jgi:hypothetical protein
MSNIDYTKPTYIYQCAYPHSNSVSNDLGVIMNRAAYSADNDSDGDSYIVYQAIKKVTAKPPEAVVTNMPTA